MRFWGVEKTAPFGVCDQRNLHYTFFDAVLDAPNAIIFAYSVNRGILCCTQMYLPLSNICLRVDDYYFIINDTFLFVSVTHHIGSAKTELRIAGGPADATQATDVIFTRLHFYILN